MTKKINRLNRRTGWLALLTVWVVLLAALPAAAEAVIPENVTVRNLSAILPEFDESSWQLRFAFLSGNRLFAVTDRLTLIDSSAIEVLATAPLPESAAEGADIYQSDWVQELDSGILWTVGNMNANSDEFVAFELDGELRPIREISLTDSLDVGILPISYFTSFDFAPDGETIFYLHALEGLRCLNRTTGEVRSLYRTERTPDNPLHHIGTLRLIDRGEKILFIGGTYDLNPDLQTGHTNYVYGLMSIEGELLKTIDPAELDVPFNLDSVKPLYPHTPQSSPIALLIPSDPIRENPMDFTPIPPKSVFAWNTETDEIVEIPLPVSSEANFSVLSENGSYLASGMCESRDDGTAAFVARLYDTANGEALSRIEISSLSECHGAQTAVSETDRIIRAIYRENGIAYYVEIPF